MASGAPDPQKSAAQGAATTRQADEPWSMRFRRRARTWPAWTLGACLMFGLLPVWIALALIHDLLRRRRLAALRLTLLTACLLALEGAGVCSALMLGLLAPTTSARGQRLHRILQSIWARGVLGAGMALMSMRLEVTGRLLLTRGPLLILPRHTSLADSLLPTMLTAGARGLRLRYVLKHELLLDPCLDLVGNRLPNAFVRRGTGGDAAAQQLAALAHDLGEQDAVVIFPEGTRASNERRRAAMASREAAGDVAGAARVASFRQLLPPHLSGVHALLSAAPDADVAFIAHVGFDGVVSLADMLSGKLIGRTVRVHIEHVGRASIPTDLDARRDWLDGQWRRMDTWVNAALRDEGVESASEFD